jgi:hypothetical protein
MATENGAQNDGVIEPQERADGESFEQNTNESNIPQESLAIHDAPVKLQVPSSYPAPVEKVYGAGSKDSEVQDANDNSQPAGDYSLEPLDWDEFETRYSNAMAKANETEAALHKEFEELMSVRLLSVYTQVSY